VAAAAARNPHALRPRKQHPRPQRTLDADYGAELAAYHDRGGPISEEYRALRSSVLAQCPSGRFCYVITSAESGEGKTVTTLNLGLVMAERVERSTLVIDCDLRRGCIADMLRLKRHPGLSEYLRGEATLEEIVQTTALPNLRVIAAGRARKDEVAELVGRPELETLLADCRRQHDFVLIDTPPVMAAADAGVVGALAGEAVVVVRMNRTNRELVTKTVEQLKAASVRTVGLVLTHRQRRRKNYLYRYYHGS
jgi:receptor protein-tyrosine kinase